MKPYFFEIIDLKLTSFFSFMLILFTEENVTWIYKIICGIIFIGYNLDRWRIMRKEYKNKIKPNEKISNP